MPVYVSDLLTATAAPVNAVPTATRTWQWLRGSSAISGATSSTYTAVTADIGSPLAASQIETNVAGSATATSAPTEVIQAFDPIRLFSASEPGVWYDPNDISTLFKGTTNLTPVTAPGDAVSAMLDKSRGLVLGPQLVNNGTFAGGTTGWDNVTASLSVVDGEGIVTGGSSGYVRQVITTVVGKSYQVTCSARIGTTNRASLSLGGVYAETTSSTTTALFCLFTATGTSANLWLQVANAGTAFFDNISVKELPGNHATQATTASQPIYGIVPAGGRRNLLSLSEQFDNAFWVKVGLNAFGSGSVVNTTATTDPVGGNTAEYIQENSASGDHTAYVNGINLTAAPHTFTVYCKSAQRTWVYVRLAKAAGQGAYFNLSSGTVGTVEAGITAAITPVGTTGWYRCSVTITTDTTPWYPTILMATGDNQGAYTGNGTSGIFIWGAQLEQSATATPYQRVTTQYDVTEAGVASLGYLFFDGSGDFMSTGTITPGTDKAQVFTGVRKLSDAASRVLVEYGPSVNGTVGTWGHLLPDIASAGSLGLDLRGNGTSGIQRISTGTAPASFISSVAFDLAGTTFDTERPVQRINGVTATVLSSAGSTDTGGGNFTAQSLFFGARSGGALPFNGHIHSLIVRFGPNLTTARISATESWVASKTAGAPSL